MKKYIIFLLQTIFTSSFAVDIDTLIANIATPKSLVSNSEIATLKDPFEKPRIVKDANDTNKTVLPAFKLGAIFEGAALIDGKWIKPGQDIHGYKLTQINKISVVIASKQDKKTLYLFKGAK